MNKKVFIISFPLFVLALAALYNYHRIVIKKDYIVAAAITCDPLLEACFKNMCVIEEREDCLGTKEYYKVIKKRAYNVPECYNKKETDKAECPPLECAADEADCQIEHCEADNPSDCEVDF